MHSPLRCSNPPVDGVLAHNENTPVQQQVNQHVLQKNNIPYVKKKSKSDSSSVRRSDRIKSASSPRQHSPRPHRRKRRTVGEEPAATSSRAATDPHSPSIQVCGIPSLLYISGGWETEAFIRWETDPGLIGAEKVVHTPVVATTTCSSRKLQSSTQQSGDRDGTHQQHTATHIVKQLLLTPPPKRVPVRVPIGVWFRTGKQHLNTITILQINHSTTSSLSSD
ncbi:hypothetical protein PIB30_012791 [Stylosanthes scabra]|uniref:Uncharacterized protein n=1 Tax=Stylosanthes scabra TaxID=79078 RepID=A0ABU6T878_9FABA|nr:hypothetical protein [Stylosanthes scabra]